MPKYPPAAGVKPEDLVKALVRHNPENEKDDDREDDKESPVPMPDQKSER